MWRALARLTDSLTALVEPEPAPAPSPPSLSSSPPPATTDTSVAGDEVDWEALLKAVKAREYSQAAALAAVKLTLRKTLESDEYGVTLQERLQAVCRDQIFRCARAGAYEETAKFAIVYKHLAGDLGIILRYLMEQTRLQLASDTDAQLEKVLAGFGVGATAEVSATASCVDALGRLFDTIARLVERFAFLEQVFGTQAYMQAMSRLQDFADIFGAAYLDAYITHYCPANMIVQLETDRRNVDLNVVAAVLEDVVLIARHLDAYRAFIRRHFEVCVVRLRDRGVIFFNDPQRAETDTTLHVGNYVREPLALYARVDDLLRIYATLEAKCAAALILQVFEGLEHADAPSNATDASSLAAFSERGAGVPVSAEIDDVFVVLQRALQRALTTRTATVVRRVTEMLERVYSHTFVRLLRAHLDAALRTRRLKYVARSLNDASLCKTYTYKLVDETHELRARLWRTDHPDGADVDEAFAHVEALRPLSGAAVDVRPLCYCIYSVRQDFSLAVVSSIAAPAIEYIRVFARTDYQLSQTDLEALQMEDPWTGPFVAAFNSGMALIEGLLADDAFDALLSTFVTVVVRELEETIRVKRFNYLGGLLFGGDWLRITAAFNAKARTRILRDKYMRMNEIRDLLSLSTLEELIPLWRAEDGVKWQLDAINVRAVLARRVDLAPAQIAALPL